MLLLGAGLEATSLIYDPPIGVLVITNMVRGN